MSLKSTRSVFADALKVLATTAGLLGAVNAHATLIDARVLGTLGAVQGDDNALISVSRSFAFPLADPLEATVGPGVEFTGTVSDSPNSLNVSADLSAEQIVITAGPNGFWGNVPGDGFSVSLNDLFWTGMDGSITGVTCTGCRNGDDDDDDAVFIPPDAAAAQQWDARFSFMPNSFDARFTLFVPARLVQSFTFDLVHSSVPEPATLALLALGLAGMGFRRRQLR